mmetsp:Transcript_59762/g.146702  ORF Transcript_59762/g.146702 Transcript_59762/m.146702 type:complete len:251 (-) Transcript_59762:3446-4198(-)
MTKKNRISYTHFSLFSLLFLLFSGAGKSTFLSLLSGKVEPTAGQLEVNGEKTSLTKFKKLVGFVPQEDIMLRELTVEENIRHSAFMRLPADWTRKQKLQRVAAVMESLELTPIKNSIIGDEIQRGISGGQRKRVNVAMELVADPSLLALDEPTSGLDSTTSYSLTETLHSLAKTGVNVAAVLHQPKNEIFEVSFFQSNPNLSFVRSSEPPFDINDRPLLRLFLFQILQLISQTCPFISLPPSFLFCTVDV